VGNASRVVADMSTCNLLPPNITLAGCSSAAFQHCCAAYGGPSGRPWRGPRPCTPVVHTECAAAPARIFGDFVVVCDVLVLDVEVVHANKCMTCRGVPHSVCFSVRWWLKGGGRWMMEGVVMVAWNRAALSCHYCDHQQADACMTIMHFLAVSCHADCLSLASVAAGLQCTGRQHSECTVAT